MVVVVVGLVFVVKTRRRLLGCMAAAFALFSFERPPEEEEDVAEPKRR